METWYLVWMLIVQQPDGTINFNMHREHMPLGYEQCVEQLVIKDSLFAEEEFLKPDVSHQIFCEEVIGEKDSPNRADNPTLAGLR